MLKCKVRGKSMMHNGIVSNVLQSTFRLYNIFFFWSRKWKMSLKAQALSVLKSITFLAILWFWTSYVGKQRQSPKWSTIWLKNKSTIKSGNMNWDNDQ